MLSTIGGLIVFDLIAGFTLLSLNLYQLWVEGFLKVRPEDDALVSPRLVVIGLPLFPRMWVGCPTRFIGW